MPRRKLNLQIAELAQVEKNQANVSLMPCPCGSSGGVVCVVARGIYYAMKNPKELNNIDEIEAINNYGQPDGWSDGDVDGSVEGCPEC